MLILTVPHCCRFLSAPGLVNATRKNDIEFVFLGCENKYKNFKINKQTLAKEKIKIKCHSPFLKKNQKGIETYI